MHMTILAYHVVKGCTILSNDVLGNGVILVKAREQVVEAFGVNLPIHGCEFCPFRTYLLNTTRDSAWSLADDNTKVVIDAQKIQGSCNNLGIACFGLWCHITK